MSNLISKDISRELELRFPSNKYTFFKLYYSIVNKGLKNLKFYNHFELKKISESSKKKIKIYESIIIIRKFTWSLKNDFVRQSQKFDPKTCKNKFDYDIYVKHILNELLIYIIDDGEECYVDEEVVKHLNKDFVDGFLNEFFKYPHFETLGDEKEAELRRAIHKYYSYWRKARDPQYFYIRNQDPPICPSIIMEVGLAEKFGWTFEYIRSMDEKDIKLINVLQSQKEIADYESSPEAKKYQLNKNGKKMINLSYEEACKEIFQSIDEEKNVKEVKENSSNEPEEEPIKEAIIETPVTSQAEEQLQKIRKIRKM